MADTRYWFPAKRYGWGWGLPVAWQGWVVLATHLALLVLGFALIDLNANALGFLLYVGVITAALLVVCWRKGEPPRWRWGSREA